MINFILLYFANLVLDYPLQGTFLAEWKQKNNYILFVHCAIWGLGLSLALIPLGLFAWWKVAMLVTGHFIIDYWKCRGLYKKWPLTGKTLTNIEFKGSYKNITEEKEPYINDMGALYIDQFLHVIQILICLI